MAAGPDFYFDFAGNKTIDGVRTDKKKAEVGINVGAGVKLLNHLQVGANYNIPLGKTASFEDIEAHTKPRLGKYPLLIYSKLSVTFYHKRKSFR